jgi:uncharacterized protein (TIGR03083 family)
VSTERVLRSIASLTDGEAHEPSRLPGWNRAEVITHLARNADGIRNMVECATRGEVGAMYPSVEARASGINAGRGASASALRADLRAAADRLHDAFESLPDDAWDREGAAAVKRTMRDLPWVRWREVEVHHVDLDREYEASDWPVSFVAGALREIFSTFDRRAISTRPLLDVDYRIVTTDHERAWRVKLRGDAVAVSPDDNIDQADGEARGWGCDVAAWLYGRDPRGGGIVATGDLGVLRLPQWFPFS